MAGKPVMHKVYASQLRHEIQCPDDQQINLGCTTTSTNTSFDYTASALKTYGTKLKIKFIYVF